MIVKLFCGMNLIQDNIVEDKNIHIENLRVDNNINVKQSKPLDIVALTPQSYLKIMFQDMDLSSIFDYVLLSIINRALQFLMYILWATLIFVSGYLAYNLSNIFLPLIKAISEEKWGLIYVIGWLIFFIAISTIGFMHLRIEEPHFSFNKYIYKVKNSLLYKIDLRSFGGDEDELSKFVIPISNINNYILNDIFPKILTYMPHMIAILLGLIFNFMSSMSSLFSNQPSFFVEIMLDLFNKIFTIPNNKDVTLYNFTDIYIIVSKIYKWYNGLSFFLIIIYLYAIVASCISLSEDTVSPDTYIMSMIDFSERLLTYGVYEAQTKIAIEMNNKFMIYKNKWNTMFMILLLIVLVLSIIILFNIIKYLNGIIFSVFSAQLNTWIEMIKDFFELNGGVVDFVISCIQYIPGLILFSMMGLKIYDIYQMMLAIFNTYFTFSRIIDSFFKINMLKFDINQYISLSNQVLAINCYDVSCGYSPDNNVLSNVNVNISTGKVILVYGASGSGKTTLFNGLQGKIYINDGSVMLSDNFNSQSLLSIYPHERQLIVASVPQVVKFNMPNVTLQEYLYSCSQKPSEQDMVKLMIDLKLVEDRDQAIKFLDKNIGLDGGVFSGGQKSRIAIAYAVLKNSLIVLVDEALDNLDMFTTKSVVSYLCNKNYIKSHIPVIISHKIPQLLDIMYELYSLSGLDNVYLWYVDQGKVSEYNVVELLEAGNLIKLLSQISGYEIPKDQYSFLKHNNDNAMIKGGK